MSTSAQTLLADAREHRRQGRFAESVATYVAVLAEDPGNLTARIERAATLSQGRRVEEAAEAIGGILADVPNHPGAHMEAGFIARAQGRHEDEFRHFETAAAGAAEPARALIQLAQAALTLGRLPRARDAALAAAAHAPDLAAAWIACGQVHRAAGDTAAEQDALRRAMQADPTRSDAKVGKNAAIGPCEALEGRHEVCWPRVAELVPARGFEPRTY